VNEREVPRLVALERAELEDTPAVWLAAEGLHVVTPALLDQLRVMAAERGRARILLHRDRTDLLQQMVIALRDRAYIRPHLNDRGFKSWHALRGRLLLAVFEDDGRLKDSFELAPTEAAAAVRLYDRAYHTLVPLSDVSVYIETCAGPFVGTTYADWAPDENDLQAGAAWVDELLADAGSARA
jgi:cupin fold WbuC family metalloprotein